MKVDDIRPDALLPGQQQAIAEDIAMLMSWRERFVEVPCPACGSPAATLAFRRHGLNYHRCSACGTQYVSPRPTPSLLAEFYARSRNYAYWAEHIYPASAEIRRTKIFAPRARMIAELWAHHSGGRGVCLEVGAGYGIFCEELGKLGIFERVVGIEPSPDLAERCRSLGIEIIEAPFEEIDQPGIADLVASFEVIEHLFDASAFVAWTHRCLRPGGVLVLTCPNIAGFDTLLLGPDAVAVDHQHMNYFTPTTLRLLLERHGFRDIVVTTPGQLDVDLVRRAWRAGKIDAARLGPFLSFLVEREDAVRDAAFQSFLQTAGLSSNMMAVARRAPE